MLHVLLSFITIYYHYRRHPPVINPGIQNPSDFILFVFELSSALFYFTFQLSLFLFILNHIHILSQDFLLHSRPSACFPAVTPSLLDVDHDHWPLPRI